RRDLERRLHLEQWVHLEQRLHLEQPVHLERGVHVEQHLRGQRRCRAGTAGITSGRIVRRARSWLFALLAGAVSTAAPATPPVPEVRPMYFEHLSVRDGLS